MSDSGASAHLQRDAVRGGLWTLLNSLVTIPLAASVNAVLVRTLGIDGLGRLATDTLIYGLAISLVNGGIALATTQWIAAATTNGNREQVAELIRRLSGFHVIVQAPVISALTALLLWSDAGAPGALFAASIVFLSTSASTSLAILSGLGQNSALARLLLLTGPAGQILAVLAAAGTRNYAWVWVAQLAAAGVPSLLALRRLPGWQRQALLRPRLPLRWPPSFVPYSLGLCGMGLISSLLTNRSEILLIRAEGAVAAAGVFAVVTALAGQLTVAMDSLLGPLLPAAAHAVARGPDVARRGLLRALAVSSHLGSLTLALGLGPALAAIPVIFGSKLHGAGGAFALLGAVSCLQSVLNPLTMFAIANRSTRTLLGVNLSALALDATVAFILIPHWPLMGAVVANACGQLLNLALLSVYVVRIMGLSKGQLWRAIRVLTLGAPIGASSALIAITLPVAPLPLVGLCLITSVAGLSVALKAFPTLLLPSQDYDAFMSALPSRLGNIVLMAERVLPLRKPAMHATPE